MSLPGPVSELASILTLERPLVITDTETTGTSSRYDRIVQVGIIKVYPDGKVKEFESLINPGEPIPVESTKIHGIDDSRMIRCNHCDKSKEDHIDSDHGFLRVPSFKELAPVLKLGLSDCDICGYNVNFDLMMFAAEFRRVGCPLPTWGPTIDVNIIFKKHHRRDLAACVREYCGVEMQGAHNALQDARWTALALMGQLVGTRSVTDLPRTVSGIQEFLLKSKQRDDYVTPDGKIVLRNGIATLNFTRQSGTPMNRVDGGMLGWILAQDFVEEDTKNWVRAEIARRKS